MRAPKTLAAAVALTAVTGLSLAACGSSSNNSSATTSSSSASSTPTPAVSVATLTGKMTQVKVDPSFVSALTSLKITPGVSGKATFDSSTGTFAFPITGGNAIYYAPGTQPAGQPYVQGEIDHQGSGITLTSGSTVVTLENFVVNPGTSELTGDVLLNGTMKAQGAKLFFLDGRTLQPATKDSAGDYVLTGTKVEIDPAAAPVLDQLFGAPSGTIPAYTLVGVATITLA